MSIVRSEYMFIVQNMSWLSTLHMGQNGETVGDEGKGSYETNWHIVMKTVTHKEHALTKMIESTLICKGNNFVYKRNIHIHIAQTKINAPTTQQRNSTNKEEYIM